MHINITVIIKTYLYENKITFDIMLNIRNISYSQQGVELKKNLYRDILNFAIKAPDLNSIGDGLERVGFKISDTSTSNDGKFITTTYKIMKDYL